MGETSFEEIKNWLAGLKKKDLDSLLQEFSLSSDLSSYYDLVEALQEHSHSGYIALWLLGEFAKHSVSWVLDIKELDLSLQELEALPDNLSNLTQLASINIRFNPIKEASVLSEMPNLKLVEVSTDQSKILPSREDWELQFLHIYYMRLEGGEPVPLKVPHPDFLDAKELYLSGNEQSKKEALELTRPFIRCVCVDNSNGEEELMEALFGNILEFDDCDLFLSDLDVSYKEDSNEPIINVTALLPLISHKDASEDPSEPHYFGDEAKYEAYSMFSFEMWSNELASHLYEIDDQDWFHVLDYGDETFGVCSTQNLGKQAILDLFRFYLPSGYAGFDWATEKENRWLNTSQPSE